MEIVKNVAVPTGNILVVKGERGLLECLSLGDYGKDVNIKCDAMGLTREPSPVRHTALLPLEEKWVITVSSQYGCSMNCRFCDVPQVRGGVNASVPDIFGQVQACLHLHPEVKSASRLNLHFARMGEPTYNRDVIYATYFIRGCNNADRRFATFHPVVSTMMPRHNPELYNFLVDWMTYKNESDPDDAGLQLSINTTDDDERESAFSGHSLSIGSISAMMNEVLNTAGAPRGRKITLNFAVADYRVDPLLLKKLFPPKYYLCKLTPMHKTSAAKVNGIETDGDYTTYEPYHRLESSLLDVGFDVLVFIASKEEDESRITCGNAILSDRTN